jgi:hypothetical protein
MAATATRRDPEVAYSVAMDDQEEDEKDITKKLREWLEKQGFPCEMQTARAFRTAGFQVRQSFYFGSSKEQVTREGDVLASLSHDILSESIGRRFKSQRAIASLEMGIVCECKTSSAAWVMFTRPAQGHEDVLARLERAATEAGTDLIQGAAMMMDAEKEFDFFKSRVRVGYHLRQSHKGGKDAGSDAAYKAAMQVLDAAQAVLKQSLSTWAVTWRPCRIVVPVIVLQAPLFECYLDDAGEMQLTPAEWLPLFWDNPLVPDRPYAVIDVVTLEALPQYIESVRQVFENLRDRHEDAIIEACTSSHEGDGEA